MTREDAQSRDRQVGSRPRVDEAAVLALVDGRASASSIGRAVGCSHTTVMRIVRDHGLQDKMRRPPKRPCAARTARVTALINGRRTATQVARELGETLSFVYNTALRLGLRDGFAPSQRGGCRLTGVGARKKDMAAIVRLDLPPEVADWLHRITPRGAPPVHVVRSILIDAFHDERDAA